MSFVGVAWRSGRCIFTARAIANVKPKRQVMLAISIAAGLLSGPAHAAELKPNTAAAFERYIRAAETRMENDRHADRFLAVDDLSGDRREEAYARLRNGQPYVDQLHATEDGKPIRVPDGLIHHWVGLCFISGATLSRAVAVLQDYDRHQTIYAPDVRRSKLLERNGDNFKIYLQLSRKSIVTVTLNATFDVHYSFPNRARALSHAYSTRIAEVVNAGKSDERELPPGNDHGYLWRLYNYWRLEEKDGGVYVQLESIALSRSVPAIFAWLVNPLLRSIPRGVLLNLLNATRRAVVGAPPSPAHLRSRSGSDARRALFHTAGASFAGRTREQLGETCIAAHQDEVGVFVGIAETFESRLFRLSQALEAAVDVTRLGVHFRQ